MSIPYGYPSGLKLVQNIINHTNIFIGEDPLGYSRSPEYQGALTQASGFTIDHVRDFNHKLSRGDGNARSFPAYFSIDEFLRDNEAFRDVGKFFIAYDLLQCEDSELLLDHRRQGAWCLYKYLFERVMKEREDLKSGQLNFITFNYDIVLETFIKLYYKVHLKLDPDILPDEFLRVGVTHMYGDLNGPLDNKEIVRNGYGGHNVDTGDTMYQAARRISELLEFIYEGRNQEVKTAKAKETILKSDYAYILGLAYHPMNLELLGLKQLGHDCKTKFFGSAMGMKPEQLDQVKKFFPREEITLGTDKQDAVEFLEGNPEFQEHFKRHK